MPSMLTNERHYVRMYYSMCAMESIIGPD